MMYKIKKGKPLFILTVLFAFVSCTDAKKNTLNNDVNTRSGAINTIPVSTAQKIGYDTLKAKESESILSGITYFFSTDTLCQTLTITQKGKREKSGIPETIKFKLVLHDKLHKYEDKIFEGTAQLFSPLESFSDYSDSKSRDYAAADYDYNATDYQIQIRVDIENYEASVAAVRTKKPDAVLGGFKAYVMEFPNYGVMKKGECK